MRRGQCQKTSCPFFNEKKQEHTSRIIQTNMNFELQVEVHASGAPFSMALCPPWADLCQSCSLPSLPTRLPPGYDFDSSLVKYFLVLCHFWPTFAMFFTCFPFASSIILTRSDKTHSERTAGQVNVMIVDNNCVTTISLRIKI